LVRRTFTLERGRVTREHGSLRKNGKLREEEGLLNLTLEEKKVPSLGRGLRGY